MTIQIAIASFVFRSRNGKWSMNRSFVTARSEATRQSMSAGIPAWIATAFGLAMTRRLGLAMRTACVVNSAKTNK